MWILLVEDEPAMRDIVQRGLEEANHTVTVARDGAEALSALASCTFDAVLLDLMLPVHHGIQILRQVRAVGNPVPVLVLTALDGSPDVIAGLDAGADDYLVKPFPFDVLLARLRAISRRAATPPIEVLRFDDLTMTPTTRTVERGGTAIDLTQTEYRVLEFLLRRAGRVASRSAMIEGIWGCEAEVEPNTVDVFVKLLRDKIDSDPTRRLIHTVRGFGYVLRET